MFFMRRKNKSPDISADPSLAVGWARQSRHHVENKQVKQLQDAGCRVVYRASDAHIEDLIRALRPEAPEPVRVTTLARLASSRESLRDAIASIHSKGAWIEEISTGRSTKTSAISVIMGLDAADELGKDSRTPTKRQAREMARKSHAVRNANTEASRMPIADARAIWQGHPNWSNDDCLMLMHGWTEATAYRKLGPRQLAKGRPRAIKQVKP